MHGQISRDLFRCSDSEGNVDLVKFFSLHSLNRQLENDLRKLCSQNLISIDDSSEGINEIVLESRFMRLFKDL